MANSVLGSQNTREWTDIAELPGMARKIRRGYIAVNRKGQLMYIQTGKLKELAPKSDGYKRLCWEHKKKAYSIMLHRLVAMAYCDGYKNGLVVDHLDTDKLNNNSNNLVFGTQKQNSNNPKTLAKLRRARVRGSRRVTAYFFDGKPFYVFDSIKDAAKELHLPKLPLQEGAIRREGVKHCYGLLWKSTPCTDKPKDLTRKERSFGKNEPMFMSVTTFDGNKYVASSCTAVAKKLGTTVSSVRKSLETGEPCNGVTLSQISCREYWAQRTPKLFA